jgi:O6-methylguanine-DNA--protein-cysteine methyltransferase
VTTVRAKFRPSRALLASVRAEAGVGAGASRQRTWADRRARQLARAYWIARKIDAGEIASYEEMAKRLGVTSARVSQIVSRMLLSVEEQDRVLIYRPSRATA